MQVSLALYWEDWTISPADPWDSEKLQLGPLAESSEITLCLIAFAHFVNTRLRNPCMSSVSEG